MNEINKTVSRPRVKDLSALLAQCDPEALLFVSDKHDPVHQLWFLSGVTPVDDLGYPTLNDVYSETGDAHILGDKPRVPSVRIDTGC